MSNERTRVNELALHGATGCWEVASSGPTRYVVDLDVQPPRCMRVTGPGTNSRGSTDNRWAPLVRLRTVAPDGTTSDGVVRVGERPVWDLDNGLEVVWWMQRLVTAIRPLDRDEVPEPAPNPRLDEALTVDGSM